MRMICMLWYLWYRVVARVVSCGVGCDEIGWGGMGWGGDADGMAWGGGEGRRGGKMGCGWV